VPAQALRAVRARLVRGWSQGANARDGAGRAVGIASDEAEAWSLLGAFALAATDGIPLRHVPVALRALADVTQARSLNDWNDAPSRNKEEVLSALDSAIGRIEGNRGPD
jgi:hypothetical protein